MEIIPLSMTSSMVSALRGSEPRAFSASVDTLLLCSVRACVVGDGEGSMKPVPLFGLSFLSAAVTWFMLLPSISCPCSCCGSACDQFPCYLDEPRQRGSFQERPQGVQLSPTQQLSRPSAFWVIFFV